MLLPLSEATARELSLPLHLALATCRGKSGGNAHLFNELLRVLYITFYLQEKGFGESAPDVYARAEAGINATLAAVKRTKNWQIDEETARLFEELLRTHDAQLAQVSLRDLTAATQRLMHFIRGKTVSPLPFSMLGPKEASKTASTGEERDGDRSVD